MAQVFKTTIFYTRQLQRLNKYFELVQSRLQGELSAEEYLQLVFDDVGKSVLQIISETSTSDDQEIIWSQLRQGLVESVTQEIGDNFVVWPDKESQTGILVYLAANNNRLLVKADPLGSHLSSPILDDLQTLRSNIKYLESVLSMVETNWADLEAAFNGDRERFLEAGNSFEYLASSFKFLRRRKKSSLRRDYERQSAKLKTDIQMQKSQLKDYEESNEEEISFARSIFQFFVDTGVFNGGSSVKLHDPEILSEIYNSKQTTIHGDI